MFTTAQYPRLELKQMMKSSLLPLFLLCLLMLFMVDPALAGGTGTGTGTGTGGVGVVQNRVNTVVIGWQNIVQGVGVAVLIAAWSIVGYQISFNGKTMKDLINPALGTTVAGLAVFLVGWMFS